VYPVVATSWPPRAMSREVKPGGRAIPFESNAPSAPYGLPTAVAGAANAFPKKLLPSASPPAPARVAPRKTRRV
jgi:hypothetical protein